jgi:hypothetical protein
MDKAFRVHGYVRIVYKNLVGKPEAKKPNGRHGYSWEDNIKTEAVSEDVNWIHVTQDTDRRFLLLNTAVNVLCSTKREIFLTS